MTDIPNRLTSLVSITRKAFTPIALCSIAFLVVSNINDIKQVLKEIEIATLLIPTTLLIVIHVLVPTVTMLINDHHIKWRKLFAIHTHRLPARYLPGGIWQTLSKAIDYKETGMPTAQIGKITILEIALSLFSAFTLSSVLLYPVFGFSILLTGIASSTVFLLSFKYWKVPFRKLLYAFAIYIIIWITISFSFSSYLSAFNQIGLSMSQVAGSYLISWIAGYLAIFAPQGLGVTEYTFCWITNNKDPAFWITIIFGFRLITLAADVTTFTLSTLITPKPKQG